MRKKLKLLFDLYKSNQDLKKDNDFQRLIKSESIIVWYPNSDNDIQDIAGDFIENSFGIKPNFYIHNDYNVNNIEEVNEAILNRIVLDDNLELLAVYDLDISDEKYLYQTEEFNISSSDDLDWIRNISNENPVRKFCFSDFEIEESFTLPIDINMNLLGKAKLFKIKKKEREIWLLYIVSETFTFFTKVLVYFGFQIDCLFKVREGIGLGGGIENKSISNLFPFLKCIKTQFLISDIQIRPNYEFLNQLAYILNVKNVNIFKHTNNLGDLSGLRSHSYIQTKKKSDSIEEFFSVLLID